MTDKPVRPLVSAGVPRRARIPMHRARRWLADGENGHASGVQVFVTQPSFRAINTHANSDLDNEVGGWLAGRWCRDVDTKAEFVVVEALLPAQQVRSGSTFLTFTHDSQVAMLAALEERYAKKGIVGWYHTHPRMGLFLSGYDVWLHEHFFPYPWQVALVLEPHGHIGGFFVRNKNEELDSRRYFGFYELLNRKGESIVDWRNVHPEKRVEPKPAPASGAALSAVKPPAVKTLEPKAVEAKHDAEVPVKKAEVKVTKASQPVAVTTTEAPKRVEVKAETRPAAEVKTAPAGGRKAATEAGVLKKFEGPKPPAKVHLNKKDEPAGSDDHEAKASEETK